MRVLIRETASGWEKTGHFFREEVLFLLFDRDDDPLREEDRFDPDPPFFPPPSCLFTVAQARRAASLLDVPRFS